MRNSHGDEAYTIRHAPRRKGGIWSKVKLDRFEALKSAGLMTPAGERALKESTGPKGVYSYEKPLTALAPEDEALFRRNKAAWADWEKRPIGYRKVVLHWVTSAKRPDTCAKRLATLIDCCAKGEKIPGYDWQKKPRPVPT